MLTNKVCVVCGLSFKGGPRAKYCITCREDIKKDNQVRYRRSGAKRKLGSVDKCKVCGENYVVNGSNQMYCGKCRESAVAEVRNKQSIEWYGKNSNRVNTRKKLHHTGLKKCVVCGKEFINHTKRNTCSDKCWREHKNSTWRKNYHERKKNIE